MELSPTHSMVCVVAAVLACANCAGSAPAQTDIVHGTMFTLTNTPTAPNGVWSWFEDERAIIDDTNPTSTLLIVSSVSAGVGVESGDVTFCGAIRQRHTRRF